MLFHAVSLMSGINSHGVSQFSPFHGEDVSPRKRSACCCVVIVVVFYELDGKKDIRTRRAAMARTSRLDLSN